MKSIVQALQGASKEPIRFRDKTFGIVMTMAFFIMTWVQEHPKWMICLRKIVFERSWTLFWCWCYWMVAAAKIPLKIWMKRKRILNLRSIRGQTKEERYLSGCSKSNMLSWKYADPRCAESFVLLNIMNFLLNIAWECEMKHSVIFVRARLLDLLKSSMSKDYLYICSKVTLV